MADNLKVGLGVEVNGVEQSINSIKDLKNAIKAAKDEQVSAALKFGETSKEYVDAGKKLAALKDKVEDLNDSTKSLKGSGLERAKEGLSQFGEGLRNLDFDKVKIGLSGLKTALASTGILLITAAVGYLIENFDELSKSTGALGTVLRTVGDVIKTVTNFVTDLIGITSSASRELEDLAEQNVANAEAAKEALASQTAEYDRQINAAKLAGKSTVDLEIAKQQAIINTNKALVEQTIAYVRQGGILDDEKKKALNEQLEAIKGAVAQQNTIELTAQKDREEKNKAAFEKRKEENKKLIEDNQKRSDEYLKTQEDELNALKKKIEDERALLEQQRLDELALEDALLADKNKKRLLNAELDALNDKDNVDKQIALLETKRQIELQNLEITGEERALINKKYADQEDALVEESEKKKRQLQRETIQKNIDLTKTSLEGLQALSDTFFAFKMAKVKKGSAEEEALARKQFEINKAMQLGMAVINGVQSILAITSVPDFTMGVASAIRIGAQVALNAASIAKIATSKFGSTSGASTSISTGGASTGGESIPAPPTINNANNNINGTQFDEQGNRINGGQQNPQITVTAQVVESHMTAMQHSVSTIKQQAIF